MANEDQLQILRQGEIAWDKLRTKNLDIKVDLGRADL